MSIIITDLEMPTERESYNLTIKYNGTVLDTETGMQVAEAHELPPHGRLIDADWVRNDIDKKRPGRSYEDAWALTIIDAAPTVIPAEEGETCILM